MLEGTFVFNIVCKGVSNNKPYTCMLWGKFRRLLIIQYSSRKDDIQTKARGIVKNKYLVILMGQFSPVLHKNICTHRKCLNEVLLMSTHNICFNGEVRKIIPE